MSYGVAAMAFLWPRGVRAGSAACRAVELCGSRAAAAMPRRLETVGACALSTTHAVFWSYAAQNSTFFAAAAVILVCHPRYQLVQDAAAFAVALWPHYCTLLTIRHRVCELHPC